ncbi:hypothetical protein Ancab_026347 [Ancistrocladus abbreviatus]
MGSSISKVEKPDALRLCKERKRFIKQAIDSRYALAAAHVCYIQSLRNIAIALRRFAEAEVLLESSVSTSAATELEKSPSHSSYPSPSPSNIVEVSDSPLQNESPLSPPASRLSYMRSGGTSAVTVRYNLASSTSLDDESTGFPVPPPPLPPRESGHSWDFFDPSDESESLRFAGHSYDGMGVNSDGVRMWGQNMVNEAFQFGVDGKGNSTKPASDKFVVLREGAEVGELPHTQSKLSKKTKAARLVVKTNGNTTSSQGFEGDKKHVDSEENKLDDAEGGDDVSVMALLRKGSIGHSGSKKGEQKDLGAETKREDPSEFITHRAKDFLSSIKDIEHRFLRASESGKEVSRMLEANNIRVGFTDAKGSSSSSAIVAVFHLVCCHGKDGHASLEPLQHVTKFITWKRSMSSLSSSSRNPLAATSKDDADDSGSDFIEDFCMISGSHSSTLDRLYAWERKLYDEVKASEVIRKEYDRKCDQLRHQFAKGLSAQVIDKTRAAVKDLHSRVRVALHSVNSISKRIEKMRDEELEPQLMELIQGFTRMWKAMLECHHAQFITISLAYHATSLNRTHGGDSRKQAMAQLHCEFECFGLSFVDWVNTPVWYVEALNGWLQSCIMQPQERLKSRRPFSPRRALAPPIFVLCRDWAAGIKALPSAEVSGAINNFLSDLRHLMKQQTEDEQKTEVSQSNEGEIEGKEEETNADKSSNLVCMHTSLVKVLDRLTKFAEASLKLYEETRQKSEAARVAYHSCKPSRYDKFK